MTTFDAVHPRIGNGTFTNAARNEATATVLDKPAPVVSDDDVEWFTYGHCLHLAVELHQRTGWPFAVCADGSDKDGVTPWVHIGVQRPDGLIVDVNGPNDPNEWTEKWSEMALEWDEAYADITLEFRPTTAELGFDIAEVVADEGNDISRARRVADALLSE